MLQNLTDCWALWFQIICWFKGIQKLIKMDRTRGAGVSDRSFCNVKHVPFAMLNLFAGPIFFGLYGLKGFALESVQNTPKFLFKLVCKEFWKLEMLNMVKISGPRALLRWYILIYSCCSFSNQNTNFSPRIRGVIIWDCRSPVCSSLATFNALIKPSSFAFFADTEAACKQHLLIYALII